MPSRSIQVYKQRKHARMFNADNHEPVDYASTNSSTAEEAQANTAPTPSFKNAATTNTKAAAAAHPAASSHAVAHPPSHSSGAPAAAKKSPTVYRSPGVPTAMHVQRGQQNHRPNPTPVPSPLPDGSGIPPRKSWTTRDSAVNSAMSSVARRRGSVAQGARARSEELPPPFTQFSARRREVSQASSFYVSHSVERHRGQSEGFTDFAVGEPASVPPFQLLSAGRPVPELPYELEDTVTTYYLHQLRQLSVADQERIVYAMVASRDVKAVMTYLKQQDQVGAMAAATAEAPQPGSAQATPVRYRGYGVQSHPLPKNAPRSGAVTSSRRRILQEYHDVHHSPQLQSFTAEQKAALTRFRQHFTVEACAAFLDDALEVCIARRTRCYQEQPRIAKERGVVLPEEHLMPFYTRSVSSLLYNMTGWTQSEARRLSWLVVSIVHDWMPTVVAQTPTPQESAKQPQAAVASIPLSKRPPVPMAPRSNAPQPVAVA